ncbi:MAG: MASE1 domain-containing protein, partial [Verrucomicrobiota bacterium]
MTRLAILVALYFVAGFLGKGSSFSRGELVMVLPQAGIALGAILLFGKQYWPAIAIGAFLSSVWSSHVVGFFSLGIALGSTLGALACGIVLELFFRFRTSMERVRDVAGFVVAACLVGAGINAFFEAGGLCLDGSVPWRDLFFTTGKLWIPNALALLIVAPVLLTWR